MYCFSLRTLSAVAFTVVLAACGSTTKLDETPVETRIPKEVTPNANATGTSSTSSTNALPASQVGTVRLNSADGAGAAAVLANQQAQKAGRVIYFDYDSFEIKDDYRGIVDAHAKALSLQRTKRMLVEGHTDERGGREYNLALGQKRADAVAKSMVLLGASDVQVEAVSFGKERPAVAGVDEASWAKNRRVELKDR